jgi:hypothetical protein
MGAFTGFLSGLMNGAKNKQQPQQPDMASGAMGKTVPAGTQAPTSPSGLEMVPPSFYQSGYIPPQQSAPPPPPQRPINTQQTLGSGWHGLVPMAQNYYANHQAKQQDAVANTHVQALQDANTTPEQRQYHINQLMQIYHNRPDILQGLGIGGYNVPSVQATPPAAQPAAAGGK